MIPQIYNRAYIFSDFNQGRFYEGARGATPNEKCGPQLAPHFGPASLDFHLNRPVISLIQLHIVPPDPPAGIVAPHWPLVVWLSEPGWLG